MASAQSVCMIGGDGDTSYVAAPRTPLCRVAGVQSRLKPLVEQAISVLCGRAGHAALPPGSGSGVPVGPERAGALASAAVDAVRCQPSVVERCREICVYLNELPNNDFNTVFKDVPSFLREHGNSESGGGPLVMVFGAPGSFYGRLFPAETLHLVCSSPVVSSQNYHSMQP